MLTFKYGIIARIIYRWINVPVSILMILQLMFLIPFAFQKLFYLIPIVIDSFILFYLNRFYFFSYKHFPFEIVADNEKIVCRDFMDDEKEVTILLNEIIEIRGGLFTGNLARPIYISDGKNLIGFHSHLKESNKLLTLILSNIPQTLYNSLLEKMKIQREEFYKKITTTKKSKKKKRTN